MSVRRSAPEVLDGKDSCAKISDNALPERLRFKVLSEWHLAAVKLGA